MASKGSDNTGLDPSQKVRGALKEEPEGKGFQRMEVKGIVPREKGTTARAGYQELRIVIPDFLEIDRTTARRR